MRRPHWKAPPAKLHHAAAIADREDDPAPGTRYQSEERLLLSKPQLDDPSLTTGTNRCGDRKQPVGKRTQSDV